MTARDATQDMKSAMPIEQAMEETMQEIETMGSAELARQAIQLVQGQCSGEAEALIYATRADVVHMDDMLALKSFIASLEAKVREQAREIEGLRGFGVIEVMIRNPQVDEYIKNTEARIDTANARIAELKQRFTIPIVCICGSTRFKQTWINENARLTGEGNIVLSVGFWGHHERIAPSPEIKERLDEIHKRKIDLCDWVWVVDVGGYIGDSTRSEIEYAQKLGRPVRYLSQEFPGYIDPADPLQLRIAELERFKSDITSDYNEILEQRDTAEALVRAVAEKSPGRAVRVWDEIHTLCGSCYATSKDDFNSIKHRDTCIWHRCRAHIDGKPPVESEAEKLVREIAEELPEMERNLERLMGESMRDESAMKANVHHMKLFTTAGFLRSRFKRWHDRCRQHAEGRES